MKSSRRKFLRLGGAASALLASGGCSARSAGAPSSPRLRWTRETATVCPYCAVGCGMIVGTAGGRVVHVEGDPDHPISGGALCSKGATLPQLVRSDRRVLRPRYRAGGEGEWREVEWGWALDRIARRIKRTRDSHWIETDSDGRTVRRTEAIASVGSAALDNEECILLTKALRSLGLVYIEHQARI